MPDARLIECMLERYDAHNEDEFGRVTLTMEQKGAARDATPNLERLVQAGRSTFERVQENVRDWKRYYETTTGAELDKSSVVQAVADEVDDSDGIPTRATVVRTMFLISLGSPDRREVLDFVDIRRS